MPKSKKLNLIVLYVFLDRFNMLCFFAVDKSMSTISNRSLIIILGSVQIIVFIFHGFKYGPHVHVVTYFH